MQAKQVAKLQKQLSDAQAHAAKLQSCLDDTRGCAAAIEVKCKEVCLALSKVMSLACSSWALAAQERTLQQACGAWSKAQNASHLTGGGCACPTSQEGR